MPIKGNWRRHGSQVVIRWYQRFFSRGFDAQFCRPNEKKTSGTRTQHNVPSQGSNSGHFSRQTYKFYRQLYRALWLRVASWTCFSGVTSHEPGVFIYRLDAIFAKKWCSFWVVWNPTLASTPYLATLLLKKGDEDYFSPKLRVH